MQTASSASINHAREGLAAKARPLTMHETSEWLCGSGHALFGPAQQKAINLHLQLVLPGVAWVPNKTAGYCSTSCKTRARSDLSTLLMA